MKMRAIGIVLAVAVALPASAAAPPSSARAVRTITYETGPCFGACPVYRIIVGSDGSGVVETRLQAAATRRRPFTATRRQFRDFARQLEPARPASGSVRYDAPPRCRTIATDMPSVDVHWTMAGGGEQQLYFYYGCDMVGNRALAERLRAAPSLLPIASLIGARP
jgi:hypothetical protein